MTRNLETVDITGCNRKVTKVTARLQRYPLCKPLYIKDFFQYVHIYVTCNPRMHARAREHNRSENFSSKIALYKNDENMVTKVTKVTALILKGNRWLHFGNDGYNIDSKGISTLKGGENLGNHGYNVDSKGKSRKVLCIKQIGPSVQIRRYSTAAEGFDLDLLFQNVTRPSGDPCGPNRDAEKPED